MINRQHDNCIIKQERNFLETLFVLSILKIQYEMYLDNINDET